MGANIAFAGDWERGCALIERSMDLNPEHPVWYRGMLSYTEYWKGNYRAAVDEAVKTNAPGLFWLQIVLAANGQLGEKEAAATAVQALNAQVPTFSADARDILRTRFLPDIVDQLIEGLQKARRSGSATATTRPGGSLPHARDTRRVYPENSTKWNWSNLVRSSRPSARLRAHLVGLKAQRAQIWTRKLIHT